MSQPRILQGRASASPDNAQIDGEPIYGKFLDEENAASILEHEVQDLFYYVRRSKHLGQGSAIIEWKQCISVCQRALRQFYQIGVEAVEGKPRQ